MSAPVASEDPFACRHLQAQVEHISPVAHVQALPAQGTPVTEECEAFRAHTEVHRSLQGLRPGTRNPLSASVPGPNSHAIY